MANQIEAFIRLHSFSAFYPIFTSFCLIACLPNAGPTKTTDKAMFWLAVNCKQAMLIEERSMEKM